MGRIAYFAQGLAVATVMLGMTAIARPAGATVINGSFENPDLAPGTILLNSAGFTGSAGITNSNAALGVGPTPDGDQFAFFQSQATNAGTILLFGTISLDVTGLVVGESYTFSFFQMRGGSSFQTPYRVFFNALSGNTPFGLFTPTIGNWAQVTTGPMVAVAESGFLRFEPTFPGPAPPGVPFFVGTTGFDLVTVNQVNPGPVPEPSTWVMMLTGFGLVGFALRRGRRVRFASA